MEKYRENLVEKACEQDEAGLGAQFQPVSAPLLGEAGSVWGMVIISIVIFKGSLHLKPSMRQGFELAPLFKNNTQMYYSSQMGIVS